MSLTDAILKPLLSPLQMTVDLFSPPVQAATSRPFRAARVIHSRTVRSRRAQDGRMVISGTFRDVCAELDRLAT